MRLFKLFSLSLALVGVVTLAGCTMGVQSEDAPLQGTWSVTQQELGVDVKVAMTFDDGTYNFTTSFEVPEEFMTPETTEETTTEDAGEETTAEIGVEVSSDDTTTKEEAETADVVTEETTETEEDLTTAEAIEESVTIKADYTVDSVEESVFHLTLTNFSLESSDDDLLADLTTESLEAEMGKMYVDVSTEGEMVIRPEQQDDEEAITLYKE